MKRDGVNWLVPFAKRDINRGLRYEPKSNQPRVILIRFAGNLHVYQAPESSYFIAARAIGVHEALFNF